jgi:hypothetical protein
MKARIILATLLVMQVGAVSTLHAADSCDEFAMLAGVMVDKRDAGVPEETTIAAFQVAIDRATPADQEAKREIWHELLLAMIKIVYMNPQESRAEFINEARLECEKVQDSNPE